MSRSNRRSPAPRRSATRSSAARQRRGPFSGPWLFLLGLAVLVVVGVYEGPKVARQVASVVGFRRVEAHADVLLDAAAESGLDPHFLAGVMYVESRGAVDAVSRVGAMGLFQLMPAAASDAAKRLKLPEPSRAALLSDPRLNARLGASHLRWLVKRLGPDLERVLVAYNAGPGRLDQWEKEAGGWSAWRERSARRGNSETLAYAQDVLRFADRFRERGVIAAAATARRPVTAGLSSEVLVPGGAAEGHGEPPAVVPLAPGFVPAPLPRSGDVAPGTESAPPPDAAPRRP
ncbi:MAG: lytic transglycosylase domain-containing protein [Planctomycetes bacterium]|nr:lytic transglycosylase domain-containing protein [Planctomycetota bacterium]